MCGNSDSLGGGSFRVCVATQVLCQARLQRLRNKSGGTAISACPPQAGLCAARKLNQVNAGKSACATKAALCGLFPQPVQSRGHQPKRVILNPAVVFAAAGDQRFRLRRKGSAFSCMSRAFQAPRICGLTRKWLQPSWDLQSLCDNSDFVSGRNFSRAVTSQNVSSRTQPCFAAGVRDLLSHVCRRPFESRCAQEGRRDTTASGRRRERGRVRSQTWLAPDT